MDVHVPRAVAVALRLRSVHVLTAQEGGSAELDDDALLQPATELGRAPVSQDKDLLREGRRRQLFSRHFSGIVYAHQRWVSIGRMVEDLELVAQATTLEEWAGRREYLSVG
ncbi:MAG TPA: hypothetical protein VIY49_29870 [Bryobacteraceae bacterium]